MIDREKLMQLLSTPMYTKEVMDRIVSVEPLDGTDDMFYQAPLEEMLERCRVHERQYNLSLVCPDVESHEDMYTDYLMGRICKVPRHFTALHVFGTMKDMHRFMECIHDEYPYHLFPYAKVMKAKRYIRVKYYYRFYVNIECAVARGGGSAGKGISMDVLYIHPSVTGTNFSYVYDCLVPVISSTRGVLFI